MLPELRKSGIYVLGDVAWGTHFCQFYQTREDLLELLVPYFAAGLENNEFCVWVVCPPLTKEDALQALQKNISDFDQYLKKQSIELISYDRWFLADGKFDETFVGDAFGDRLKNALAKGYDGMRVNGNETWLANDDWGDFMDFEHRLDTATKDLPVIVSCTYHLPNLSGSNLLDVAHSHDCMLAKRRGNWEILEEQDVKKAKAKMQRESEELEYRVAERTKELAMVVDVLQNEVNERKKAEDELRMVYRRLSYHVENTPLAVIEWDRDMAITRWSGQAEKIFGWSAAEALGKNMYDPDFPLVFEEDKPKVERIAMQLRQGLVSRNLSLNRNYTKGGKVIYCEWYQSALKDEDGNIITILSLTHDVTERKISEEKLNRSYEQIRSLSEHLRSVREEERKYVAREIHDELGQYLTVLKMDAGLLSKKLQDADAVVRTKLRALMGLIDTVVYSVRRIASELRPSLLDDLGLTAAIEWHLEEFKKRTGIKTRFIEPPEELLVRGTTISVSVPFHENISS